MPLIRELLDLDPTQWTDGDLVPRPVVTFGVDGIALDDLAKKVTAHLHRKELDFHRHLKGQFVLAVRGVLTCEVAGGLWLVPPQGAIWIPGGVLHKIEAAGDFECYVTHIDPAVAANLPANCCALSTTPLLRELLIRSASMPMLYDEGGFESHLVTLLLDEIAVAPVGNLHLPRPADARLRKIFEKLMADPADRATARTWARRVGLSERTLARRLAQETGMSFGRWRQQLALMLSLQWLAEGASIQQVADGLGYESASSFVSMFRKAMGVPPGRYLSERRPQRG